MMDTREKPVCEYGAKCYRKNPKHLENYCHPHETKVRKRVFASSAKKTKQEDYRGNKTSGFGNINEEQTSKFLDEFDTSSTHKPQNDSSGKSPSSAHKKKTTDKKKLNKISPFKKKDSENEKANWILNKKAKTDGINGNGDCESTRNISVFTENNTTEAKCSSGAINLKNKTPEEIIKALFLVDMPPDFYSFYDFCTFFEKSNNLKTVQFDKLKLVGPFDVLSGKLNLSLDPDLYLCHWRFYYDPPEFQTVLAAESGYHIGYWRDDPKENPVFLASNNSNQDCIFKIEAENLFGAVYQHLSEVIRTGDPFAKVKFQKLQLALKNWAEENEFSLEKKNKIKARQKMIVSKTFHGAGIVVPVDAKTQLGYRPLIETNASLRKICNLIMKANDESERESLWENLQPLITAANIANDECDFGNSLELGIDLFCMGSPVFHKTVEHLLSTAYSLLDRTEFKEIIRAHLKYRRKDNNMSLCY